MAIVDEPTVSPFLTGLSEPVFDEIDVADLAVAGEIPDALNGVYLRNGSNPQFAPSGPYHPFDGDGMVHAVYLSEGTARYRNRFVATPGLTHERAAGRALFGGAMNLVLPPEDLMEECGFFKNAANTNIIRHAGKTLALWEGGFPTELDDELNTVGLHGYGGKLEGAMTAHPKWDVKTGELVFMGYNTLSRPFLRYHVANAAGELVHTCEIDIPRGVMVHDFLTTEHYSIFFDLPGVLEVEAMMNGEPMWQPELGARIGVMPRFGTNEDVRWFEIDPFFVFHFMNAWEDGDRIVTSGCRVPSISLDFNDADPGAMHAPGTGLYRWTIDLTAGAVTEEQLSAGFQEFPRFKDELMGYRTKYGHVSAVLGNSAPFGAFDSVVQYDLDTGSVTGTKRLGDDKITGEAVFASDPDGTEERDGWVITYEMDLNTRDTDLLILDGHDISTEVARVRLPRRVPPGFHGNWLPAES